LVGIVCNRSLDWNAPGVLIGPGSARALQRVADRLQPDHAIAENTPARRAATVSISPTALAWSAPCIPTPATDILEVNRYNPGADHGR
jgi:hypothetical protein